MTYRDFLQRMKWAICSELANDLQAKRSDNFDRNVDSTSAWNAELPAQHDIFTCLVAEGGQSFALIEDAFISITFSWGSFQSPQANNMPPSSREL